MPLLRQPASRSCSQAATLSEARRRVLQAELDDVVKQMQQMQEEQEQKQKQAADDMAAAVEQHGLELQRLSVERSKLQVGGFL